MTDCWWDDKYLVIPLSKNFALRSLNSLQICDSGQESETNREHGPVLSTVLWIESNNGQSQNCHLYVLLWGTKNTSPSSWQSQLNFSSLSSFFPFSCSRTLTTVTNCRVWLCCYCVLHCILSLNKPLDTVNKLVDRHNRALMTGASESLKECLTVLSTYQWWKVQNSVSQCIFFYQTVIHKASLTQPDCKCSVNLAQIVI